MGLSTEFWIQIVIYGASIGSFAGVVLTKLKYLEKQQEKHTLLIERLIGVEQAAKAAHERLDHLMKHNPEMGRR